MELGPQETDMAVLCILVLKETEFMEFILMLVFLLLKLMEEV